MAVTEIFNVIFGPLMDVGPLFAIAAVSVLIALISSVLYRVLVNQQKMKRIKADLKEMQEKIKKAQKEGKEKEIKALFSNSMKLNSEMMRLTMKPIIVSMVLFFAIIPWLYTNYGDVSANIVDKQGTLKFGDTIQNVSILDGSFHYADSPDSRTYTFGETIEFAGKTWGTSYTEDARGFFENLRGIEPYGKMTLENVRYKLPFPIPGIGDKVGWLGLYIIISIPATMIFRKILGVD